MKENKLINEYRKVTTPKELYNFMRKNIKYGFYGNDGKIYTNSDTSYDNEFQIGCQTQWGLADAKKVLDYGYGHCWDQVELERDWFEKHNYEFKTIFIWFLFDYENSYFTHTYLVYKDKKENTWNWFEHSDFNNKGIHKYNTYEATIKSQMEKHIELNKKCGNIINKEILTHLHIYEYEHPKFGCNMSDFLDNIFISKDISSKIIK